MTSYSLHSYSSSDSSSGRSVSDDHRNIAEQGVSPIGASLDRRLTWVAVRPIGTRG